MKSQYKYWFASALLVFSLSACGGGGGGGTPPQPHDVWTSITSTGAPTARDSHTGVWTGATGTTNANRMIVWGGLDNNGFDVDTGGIYDPTSNTWTSSTTTTNAPDPRDSHTAVLIGSKIVVWGGVDQNNNVLNTGGVYDTVHDLWTTATTTVGAPEPRVYHTAISALKGTWDVMIVSGGSNTLDFNNLSPYNDGGLYIVETDSWAPISLATDTNLTKKTFHTAVWTGATGTAKSENKLIIWGGYGGSAQGYVDTGAIYDPSLDTWTPTLVTSAL